MSSLCLNKNGIHNYKGNMFRKDNLYNKHFLPYF
jgi:hypothetical protein